MTSLSFDLESYVMIPDESEKKVISSFELNNCESFANFESKDF
jgi:hypothetical protein